MRVNYEYVNYEGNKDSATGTENDHEKLELLRVGNINELASRRTAKANEVQIERE